MRFAEMPDEIENLSFNPAQGRRLAGMQQVPHPPRQKAVRVKVILFDLQMWILALEIAGAVVGNALAENQILGASGRANRIGLNESQAIDRVLQRGRRKERPVDRVPAKGA